MLPGLVPHLHLAGFENAVAQEILDKVLQTLPAGLHVAKNFALALVERAQLFVLQQLDVAVQNRERSLKVVGRRAQGIRGAQERSRSWLYSLSKSS